MKTFISSVNLEALALETMAVMALVEDDATPFGFKDEEDWGY